MRGSRLRVTATHFVYLEPRMDALSRYRNLEVKLRKLRSDAEVEPPSRAERDEEEHTLSQMEKVWWELTEEEQELLNAEGPQTWPEGSK